MNSLEDRIRDALTSRAETTDVGTRWPRDADERPRSDTRRQLRERDPSSGTGRRGRRPILAVAATSAVLVVGLGAIVRWNDQPSSPTVSPPPTFAVEISDPLAISLDTLNASDRPPPNDRTYLVIDGAHLPDGVSVKSEGGALFGFQPAFEQSTYSYGATLIVDGRSEFMFLIVDTAEDDAEDAPSIIPWRECAADMLIGPVEPGRVLGTRNPQSACLLHPAGYVVSMHPIDTSEDFDPDVEIGRMIFGQLQFVEVDEPPYVDPGSMDVADEPTDVTFAGTLSGTRWAATVGPGELRPMVTYVSGKQQGGFRIDRSSQPDDLRVDDIAGDIDAIPGFGAILYGTAPATAVAVVASTNQDELARLPVHRRDLESFFAVPVPDTVTVEHLVFVAEDGSTVATVDVPLLPKGLGGGYDGALTSRN